MNYQTVFSKSAPSPIGPYSQAVISLGKKIIFLSGQIGINPVTGFLISEDFEEQVHQAFKNLESVAQAAEISLSNIVKFNLFLTDLKKFSVVNVIMKNLIKPPFPARSTVEVSGLPIGAQFEIDAIAMF